MPRANKESRYPDVKAWRERNPEWNLKLNRTSGATYRDEAGSPKRTAYNQEQRERAIRRKARRVALKALAKASMAAQTIVHQRRTLGYVGPLRPNFL